MPRSLNDLFRASSLRDLVDDYEPLPADGVTIRDAAVAELELRPGSTLDEIEKLAEAWIPGDGNPEDHPFDELLESVMPSRGVIKAMREAAQEGHRIAEEFPERGAYHRGPPIPDQGGIMQEECTMQTIGPFVPVPPDQVPPPAMGGFKMKIEPFDEFNARRPWPQHRPPEGSLPPGQTPRATGRVVGVARGFPVIQGD
jgi:hypothetical protein